MNDSCAESVEACEAIDDCNSILECMTACEDGACIQSCFTGDAVIGDEITSVMECLQEAGCVDQNRASNNSPVSCIEDACPDEVSNCTGDTVCADMLECWTTCGVPGCGMTCIEDAGGPQTPFVGEVLQCGQQAGCLSGGGG